MFLNLCPSIQGIEKRWLVSHKRLNQRLSQTMVNSAAVFVLIRYLNEIVILVLDLVRSGLLVHNRWFLCPLQPWIDGVSLGLWFVRLSWPLVLQLSVTWRPWTLVPGMVSLLVLEVPTLIMSFEISAFQNSESWN